MSADIVAERRRHASCITFILAAAKVAGIACDDVAIGRVETRHAEFFVAELRHGEADVVTVDKEFGGSVGAAIDRLSTIVDALARGRVKSLRAEEREINAKYLAVSADLCAAWKEEGAAAINLLGLDPLSHRPEVRAAVERDQRAKAAVKSAFQKEGRLQAAQRRAFDAWTAAQKALDDARDARDRAGQ